MKGNKHQARKSTWVQHLLFEEQINSVVINLRQFSLLTYLQEVSLRFTSEDILSIHSINNEKWANQINPNYYFTYYQFIYTRKSNQFIYRSFINVMATFEKAVKKIQIKFKILDLAVKENERIISRNKVNELVKQQKGFEKRLESVYPIKLPV